MPDFSPACQSARNSYQAAYNAYIAARDAHTKASATLAQAINALKTAQQELAAAQNSWNAATTAWDAHVLKIKAAPALGLNVEAGVLPPDAAPAGAAVAGLVQSRTPPNFSIWAAGPDAEISAWHGAADNAMQQAVLLQSAAAQARTTLDAKTLQHAAAAAAETAARMAEQAALAAKNSASEAASTARDKVAVACTGEKASHPIGGGGEFETDPGVLPEDEAEVRDRLDSLPDVETKGIKRVNLDQDVKKDPDTGETEWTTGQYSIQSQSIQLFVMGHSETTLKHEVGHHVYFDRLTAEARTRWKDFYGKGTNSQTVPHGKMPTGYAATNEIEGFAEAYEFLRDNKQLDPEVKQFLEELLGGLS